MTTPLYIFDLDGTLANLDHRLHLINNKRKDWRWFFAECMNDTPIKPNLMTLAGLYLSGAEIRIWSGRSDVTRAITIDWLSRFSALDKAYLSEPERLMMRQHTDHRTDSILKAEWYSRLPAIDKQRLIAVFEDRRRVVTRWRSLGVTCYEVDNADF